MSSSGQPPREVIDRLRQAASGWGLQVSGGSIRRTSSRFCLGVEHGDYNGTELFGVGTDRFIWLAYRPNDLGRVRLFSLNFPEEGLVDFAVGSVPPPLTPTRRWARFPLGADFVLRRHGVPLTRGFDAVLYSNIPGGGMSRSASLSLNLLTTMLAVNGVADPAPLVLVDLAQAIENDYIGSPCGQLDQIMILFAKAGMGTYYRPTARAVEYVPLGPQAIDFCLVSLDTGTVRPGLEQATYAVRRRECEQLAAMAAAEFGIRQLGDVRHEELYRRIQQRFAADDPQLCRRLDYLYHAQQRFYEMLAAWRRGDIPAVGAIFRQDGLGLRDDYDISGPELEAMCEIARSVPGVFGERMLGGGDKGAAGAIVAAGSLEALRAAVDRDYPRKCPEYAGQQAVHACQIVDGLQLLPGLS